MKYELTDETMRIEGSILHRIRALESFSDVRSGDLGGYIEKESNLSHEGLCWVYDSACVMDDAIISDNAKIKDMSRIINSASIMGNAVICDSAEVSNDAKVYGDAKMFSNSRAYHNAEVFGSVKIKDNVRVLRDAWVYGDFEVGGTANITEKTTKAPIVIMGLAYVVTIMDAHISFDCQTRTTDDWFDMSDHELMYMDKIKAIRFHRKYSLMIHQIAQMHQLNQSNV